MHTISFYYSLRSMVLVYFCYFFFVCVCVCVVVVVVVPFLCIPHTKLSHMPDTQPCTRKKRERLLTFAVPEITFVKGVVTLICKKMATFTKNPAILC